MGSTILTCIFVGRFSSFDTNVVFQFAEKRFEIEQMAPQTNGLVLVSPQPRPTAVRHHPRLEWLLVARKYDVDGTRQTLFESQQRPEVSRAY